MNAVNSVGTGSSAVSSSSSSTNAADGAASALSNNSGADSGKLGSIVDKLKAGLESGNSAQTGQAIKDLIELLKGSSEGSGKQDSAESAPAGAKQGGEAAGPSSGAGQSEGGIDVLSLLEKLLEALGLPKDQIAKILNQAQESAVGGGENANGATPGGESVSGVKAA
jgi:hypothetical protein